MSGQTDLEKDRVGTTKCAPQEDVEIKGACDGIDSGADVQRKFHGRDGVAYVAYLQEWFYSNIKNHHPSLELKRILRSTGGLTEAQVDQWFSEARKRLIKARTPKNRNLKMIATAKFAQTQVSCQN